MEKAIPRCHRPIRPFRKPQRAYKLLLAGKRVTYVQLGGGALPVSLSDTVRALKARMLLDTAIAVSPCLDGDLQCVAAAESHASQRLIDGAAEGAGADAATGGERRGRERE